MSPNRASNVLPAGYGEAWYSALASNREFVSCEDDNG